MSDETEEALKVAAIARMGIVATLRILADELEEWATEKRKPLPQGDQDVEAREAIDQQAIGLDDAADHLRDHADELEQA